MDVWDSSSSESSVAIEQEEESKKPKVQLAQTSKPLTLGVTFLTKPTAAAGSEEV